jgi:hypothetical protein
LVRSGSVSLRACLEDVAWGEVAFEEEKKGGQLFG